MEEVGIVVIVLAEMAVMIIGIAFLYRRIWAIGISFVMVGIGIPFGIFLALFGVIVDWKSLTVYLLVLGACMVGLIYWLEKTFPGTKLILWDNSE